MPSSSRPIDRAAEIVFDPANTGLDATTVQDGLDALNAIVAQGGGANAQGTWLVSGGGVAWLTGFAYRVSPAQYYITGIAHASPQTDVTLGAADATFARFDIIAATASGTVVVLAGTPAAAPEYPDTDPQQYLALTVVRVDAASSAPAGVASSTIYAENLGPAAEWTMTASAGTITLGSTSNPHAGTKCIEGTSVANGTYFEGTVSPAIDVTAKTKLVFYIRCKSGWPSQKSLSVSFRTASAQVGAAVSVASGFFGFDRADVTTYQQIVIPIAQFSIAAGTTATKLRVAVTGGGSSVGFYVDDIGLQSGTTAADTGITQVQADARYAQRAANLSDLTAAATARTNLLPAQAGNSGKFLATDGSAASWLMVGASTADTAPATIYVATTGSDTTGSGTSGSPYATLAKALSVLPDFLQVDHAIVVADGTYAEPVVVGRFLSRPGTALTIQGNTTTPASVTFTGTTSATADAVTVGGYVYGAATVTLAGVRIHMAASPGYGLYVRHRARVTLDRCTVSTATQDGLERGIVAMDYSELTFKGNCLVDKWGYVGIGVYHHCLIRYTSAGTLTVSRSDSFGEGIQLVFHSQMILYTAATNVTVVGAIAAFQLGLNSLFQHLGASSTISASNTSSTPALSTAVDCTDLSSWSTNQPVVFTRFTNAYRANSISYVEAIGTRTHTTITTVSNATQNAVIYIP